MNTPADNALVEISLALAMAFFALLVLALVSMGIPGAAEQAANASAETKLESAAEEDATKAPEPSVLLIFYRGQWYDEALHAIDPGAEGAAASRVTVGISPELTIAEAGRVQAALAPHSVSLTPLSPSWLQRLETLP